MRTEPFAAERAVSCRFGSGKSATAAMLCEARLLSLVDRVAAFRLRFPALQKVLRVEEGAKLRVEL